MHMGNLGVCVVFDVDGTLIDSELAVSRMEVEIMERFGRQPEMAGITAEWVLEHCAGKKSAAKFQMMHQKMRPGAAPLTDAMIAEMRKVRAELMPEYMAGNMVRVSKGAIECVEKLVASGIAVAAASNKTQQEVLAVFKRFDVPHFNEDNVVGAHMVVDGREMPSKPAPDMILHASRNHFTGHVVMIGDSDNDILAARAANIRAWGYTGNHPKPGLAGAALMDVGAHCVFSDFSIVPAMVGQLRQSLMASPAAARLGYTIRG